jgi:hypothetical protein
MVTELTAVKTALDAAVTAGLLGLVDVATFPGVQSEIDEERLKRQPTGALIVIENASFENASDYADFTHDNDIAIYVSTRNKENNYQRYLQNLTLCETLLKSYLLKIRGFQVVGRVNPIQNDKAGTINRIGLSLKQFDA